MGQAEFLTEHQPNKKGKGKGKSVPLQTWSGPQGSGKFRFPDFVYNGTGWW